MVQEGTRQAILIAGPTASGKSALALRLASALGGAVVNADSMQVYDGLRILTARPARDEMSGVPHHLYGHRDPALPYSVGDWLREVGPLLGRLRAEGRVPVFCGGTGLYFRALLGGLDEMPQVPLDIRDRWRQRMAQEGPQRLHALLGDLDPVAAARIRPSDPQRVTRALELAETSARLGSTAVSGATGRALVDPRSTAKIVLAPDRSVLRDRIATRFGRMLEEGARAEAVAFSQRPRALDGLAGKAIGLAELLEVEHGRSSPEQARERSVTRTRQYAKRQETWFRNQFGADWLRIHGADGSDPDDLIARARAASGR